MSQVESLRLLRVISYCRDTIRHLKHEDENRGVAIHGVEIKAIEAVLKIAMGGTA